MALSSPLKAQPKAPDGETLKFNAKQGATEKYSEDKQKNEMINNNKTIAKIMNAEAPNESDDDDSVFINENKPKNANKTLAKHKNEAKFSAQPASANAPSVMLNESNASSSKIKLVAPDAAQNHNSRDLNVQSETVVR